jgi:hypothetical protein
LEIDEVRRLGCRPSKSDNPKGFLRRHPQWNDNNSLYLGSGAKTRRAHPCLRLTRPGGPVSLWTVPAWLKVAGLTYHSNPARWANDKELHVASRGQEFVSNIGTGDGSAPFRPPFSSDGAPMTDDANIDLQEDAQRRSRS